MRDWQNEYDIPAASPSPSEYLTLRAQGFSIQTIAERWNYATRDGVYNLLKKWRADGSLAQAEHDTKDG